MSEHHHRGPWAVWVASDLDRNGEPYAITVQLADGRHVTEEDAGWLRQVIRDGDGRDDLTSRALNAEATVERVRRFVDGFAERGGGKLDPGDELWIMSILRELDGP